MEIEKHELLIDSESIKSAVAKVAEEINAHAVSRGIKQLHILWVADGAIMFAADLLRAIPQSLEIRVSCIRSSSYGDALSPAHEPLIEGDLGRFKGCDVLVVDDVLDTGSTMAAILDSLGAAGVKSAKSCVLISKRVPFRRAVEADFKCFEAGSEFVYGYGLDFMGLYRNLPDICIFRGDGKKSY